MINIFVGVALGFLSGIGVGGGSLLLLWLTLVMSLPQETARMMNLMFFVPCALTATLFRWKHGCLNRSIALPAILGGLAGAALGSYLGPRINADLLRKAFGILFILTAIRELRYKK